jgi:hypothetical protein
VSKSIFLFIALLTVLSTELFAKMETDPKLFDVYSQVSRARDGFVYGLSEGYKSFSQACGRNLWLKMEWTSFADFIAKDNGYSVSNCSIPLSVIEKLCTEDKKAAGVLLDKIDLLSCEFTSPTNDNFQISNRTLKYKSDPMRSDMNNWIRQEILKVAGINPSSIRSKENIAKEQEEQRQKDRDSQNKERDEKIKQTVEKANSEAAALAKKTQEKVKAMTDLAKWYQDEIQKIQNSPEAPAKKAPLYNLLGQEYQKKMNALNGGDK